MIKKRNQCFRLTEETLELLRVVAYQTGISQASVVELAVRQFAQHSGIPLPASSPQKNPTKLEQETS